MLKTKLATGLAATIGLLALAAPAHATEAPPAYSLFAWEITSTTGDHFATPQEYITHLKTDSLDLDQLLSLLPCGTDVQLDAYLNNATSDALIGGQLVGPGNPTEPWPGGGSYQSSYSRVLTTPDCIQPPDESTPGSSEAVDCATSTVTITNWHDVVAYTGDRTGWTAQPAVRVADADTTRPATAEECPVTVVTDIPAPPATLPVTGVEPLGGLVAALVLLLAGVAIPVARRRLSL